MINDYKNLVDLDYIQYNQQEEKSHFLKIILGLKGEELSETDINHNKINFFNHVSNIMGEKWLLGYDIYDKILYNTIYSKPYYLYLDPCNSFNENLFSNDYDSISIENESMFNHYQEATMK